MKVLCDSGLVVGRKDGKWMHYSISQEGAKIAMDCLKEITAVNKSECKCCNK
jgi:ArsR family transcriptional regulator